MRQPSAASYRCRTTSARWRGAPTAISPTHGQFRGLWVTNVGDVGGQQVDPQGRCFSGFAITAHQDEAARAAVLRSEGQRYVADHLGEVPGVIIARLGRTVGLYRLDQQADFSGAEGRNVSLDRLGTRLFQLLALIVVVGAVGPWRRFGARLLLAAPLVAVATTVALTYGSLRFRSVADPIIVLLAVLAIADIGRWAGRRIEAMQYRRSPCP